MVGITAYGAYVPRYRLDRKLIFEAMGWMDPAAAGMARGEKAVANYDEDSITMAVAAGMDGLDAEQREKVEQFCFATTTPPYLERQNAVIISQALNLGERIRTSDMVGSVRSGTDALLQAADGVAAGSVNSALVCAADSRQGKAGGAQDYLFGDGAAALALGTEKVVATLKGTYSWSCDFPDRWRSIEDRYDRVWEDRWIRDEGHRKLITSALQGAGEKYGKDLSDFSKVVISCPHPRSYLAMVKRLGLEQQQIANPLLEQVGDAGSAHPLLMLVGALEEAKAGDEILLVSYGSGVTVFLLEVTPEIERSRPKLGLKGHLERREDMQSYDQYAVFRGKLEPEKGIRGESVPSTPFSALWRERKAVLGLEGSRCKQCGTPQFPPQEVCVNPDCRAEREMESYPFADKKGELFTFTADYLAYSLSPPAVYGMVDFEGGGRYWFDITDCRPEELRVGNQIRMSFRRKYLDDLRGISGYFWKILPESDSQGGAKDA